jgi:hypothetical protein
MACPLDDLIATEHPGLGLELGLELPIVDSCVSTQHQENDFILQSEGQGFRNLPWLHTVGFCCLCDGGRTGGLLHNLEIRRTLG